MTPPDTLDAVGFYWAKVHCNFDPEPLIRWEVLHWEDSAWWATALKGRSSKATCWNLGTDLLLLMMTSGKIRRWR